MIKFFTLSLFILVMSSKQAQAVNTAQVNKFCQVTQEFFRSTSLISPSTFANFIKNRADIDDALEAELLQQLDERRSFRKLENSYEGDGGGEFLADCRAEFPQEANRSEKATPTALAAPTTDAPLLTTQSNVSSMVANEGEADAFGFCIENDYDLKNRCGEKTNSLEEGEEVPVEGQAKNICDIFRNKIVSNNPSPECKCIIEMKNRAIEYNDSNTCIPDTTRIERENVLKNRMVGSALELYGERFLNLYTKHLEDVSYYDHILKAFEGSSRNSKVMCNDFEEIKNKIQKSCGNKITGPQLNRRVNSLLNPFSNISSKDDPATMLREINDRVMKIETQLDNKGKPYTRDAFDEARKVLTNTTAPFPFIESVLDKAFENPNARNIISSGNANPMDAILQLIKDEIAKNPQKFISDNFKKDSFVSDDQLKKYQQFIADPNSENPFSKDINSFMTMHPGYQRLLSNKSLLVDSLKEMKRSKLSLSSYIETDHDLVKKHFEQQCNEMKANIAEAACMSDDDIIKKLDKKTVYESMGLDDRKPEAKLQANYLLCQSGVNIENENGAQGIFKDLKSPLIQSDYVNRMNTMQQNNPFSEVYTLLTSPSSSPEGRRFRDTMTRAMRSYPNSRYGELSDFLGYTPETVQTSGSETNFTNTKASNATTSKEADAAAKENAVAAQAQANTAAAINQNFYVPPTTTETTTPQTAEAKAAETKKKLTESLCNDSANCESVKRLVSNLDDKSAQELMQLQQENSRRQLDAMKAETDKLKADLQREIDTYKDQTSQLARARAPSKNRNKIVTPEEPARAPASIDSRPVSNGIQQAQLPALGDGQNNFARSASSNIAPATRSESGGGAARVSGVSSGASAASSSNNLFKYNVSSAQGGPVPVAGNIASNGSLVITSDKDVGQEVMNFLTQKNPDIRTLLQIKQSGMIYKYRVLENGQFVEKEMVFDYNTLDEKIKQIIDQKIAQSGVSPNQVAIIDSEIRELKRKASYEQLRAVITDIKTNN